MSDLNVRALARLVIHNLRGGCGDNSCKIQRPAPGAMGTNGGCRCFELVADAIEEAEVALAMEERLGS